MNVDVKPTRYGDLIEAEMNEDLFAFLRLHAIGHYVLRAVAKLPDETILRVSVPITIDISQDYPPECYVNSELLPLGTTIRRSGLTITRTK